MRKRTAPVDRIARMSSRVRRVDIAYRAYVLKALREFDLEGQAESTWQQRIPTWPELNRLLTRRSPLGC